MKLFGPICLALFSLGLSSCAVRFVDGQQWRFLNTEIDTIGKIADNQYLVSANPNKSTLRIFIRRNRKEPKLFRTYIANYDTTPKLVSRIDNEVNISTEIYIHGKWILFQTHGFVPCGNSYWNMKLKSGQYMQFETEKPKPGWIPCFYRIKCQNIEDVNVGDSIYSDSIISKPKILFLRPRDIAKAGRPFLESPWFYTVKKPIPSNFKLTWCDKITGSALTKEEISKNDSFIIGHVYNYKKLGSRYKIIECECAIVYKDTTLSPYIVRLAGNKIPSSFLLKLTILHSGDTIIFGSIIAEYKGKHRVKVFNLPGAKYLVKT